MAISTNEAARGLRPTLVIAEALVDRQEPGQIVDRARKLGFSPSLTNAVVTACCGKRPVDTLHTSQTYPSGLKTAQS